MIWNSATFSQVELKWRKCAFTWKQNESSGIQCLFLTVKCFQLNLKYLEAYY